MTHNNWTKKVAPIGVSLFIQRLTSFYHYDSLNGIYTSASTVVATKLTFYLWRTTGETKVDILMGPQQSNTYTSITFNKSLKTIHTFYIYTLFT